jgi:TonB family protein
MEDAVALPVWISNLVAYSLQIAILAAVGTLLAYLFRLRHPRVTLIYWQILLLACIFLPFLQRWDHPVLGPVIFGNRALITGIGGFGVPVNLKPPMQFPWEILGPILAAGIILRLVWLLLGLLRLHIFQRKSRVFIEENAVIQDMKWRTGVRVPLLLSDEIDSPVTFGFLSPRIILPLSYKNLSEPCQKAVLCHELLHVRRYDWILIVAEEVVGSLFWFHPGVWWLLNRIQLSREQAVDYEVVRLTGNKQPYLDSLLEFARSHGRPKAVPAPLFLKESHLVQRVALLLKEVSMSRSRLAVSIISLSILLIGTVRLAAGWFPLTGSPVSAQEQRSDSQVKAPQRAPIRVGGNVMESKLIYKVDPIYPEQALKARISGKVVLAVTVNEEGFVSDVRVSSGHPFLVEPAVTAVGQWQYSPTLLNGEAVSVMTTVTVVFAIDGDTAKAVSGSSAPPMPTPLPVRGSVILQVATRDAYIVFRATLIDEKSSTSPNTEDFHAPELATTPELWFQWQMMARAEWPADVAKGTPIAYSFIVNESGELTNFTRVQGPEIPNLEREVSQLRVVSPGLRGSTLVRSSCVIEIRVGMSMDEIQGLIQSNAPPTWK